MSLLQSKSVAAGTQIPTPKYVYANGGYLFYESMVHTYTV